MAATVKYHTMDDYITTFSEAVQVRLQSIRQIIHDAAPDAKETIKYHMPTFTLNTNLISFAGWKNHIALYGFTTAVIEAYKQDLAPYVTPKGTIKFPLDEPLPVGLIRNIVELRVKRHLENDSE